MRLILAIALLTLASAAVACDSFERVTLENRTTETVDILYGPGGEVQQPGEVDNGGCIICGLEPQGEDSFVDPSGDPERGRRHNYELTARETTSNIVIYSRVFTWDELRDMDWRVVITDMRE